MFMSEYIPTNCYKCDTPIVVLKKDYSSERNFCYACAMSYIGAVSC